MKEILLEQGTDDWLDWRAGRDYKDVDGTVVSGLIDSGPRITATAASVINGNNPFTSPYELWGEMVGTRQRKEANYVMERGQMMEPKARAAYCKFVGEEYQPLCLESTQNPWIGASLDGVDLLRTRGVEIKCPLSETTHGMAMNGVVPDYYYDQIQWQMLASDNQLLEIDYFSFAPKIGVAAPIKVLQDLVRQEQLIQKALIFRVAVLNKVSLAGSEFEQAAKTYLLLNRQIKDLEAQLTQAKERIKTLADGKPTQGAGVLVTVAETAGRASWEKIANEFAIKGGLTPSDVDTITKQFTSAPKVTITIREAADADAVYQSISQKQITNIVTIDEKSAVAEPSPVW